LHQALGSVALFFYTISIKIQWHMHKLIDKNQKVNPSKKKKKRKKKKEKGKEKEEEKSKQFELAWIGTNLFGEVHAMFELNVIVL
jgi:hypothetical protein